MDSLLFLGVALGASVIGAICGIGGGVIIKPVLDLLGLAPLPTINFFSACTVLSMSLYSVARARAAKERVIDMSVGWPLGIGAALGGILGKAAFEATRAAFASPGAAGAVQAALLLLLTIGTLIYTLRRDKVRPRRFRHPALIALIGLGLGLMSSYLGIGGGPINLVVLHYFFSMETKKAAQNSLFIILISQAASLLLTLTGGSLPAFRALDLLLMMAGGVLGAMMGRALNKRLDNATVNRLFIWLMVLIILISAYNVYKYAV